LTLFEVWAAGNLRKSEACALRKTGSGGSMNNSKSSSWLNKTKSELLKPIRRWEHLLVDFLVISTFTAAEIAKELVKQLAK
jgi:hypothetical protein